jgi:TfoX/Sxy family transcriptional regulator of competence genes
MTFDEALADRVRKVVAGEPGLTEKRMFGGLAMLLNGNMAVTVRGKGGLMVRVDPDDDAALDDPGSSIAVMRGRPMRGWIVVEAGAVAKPADLKRWVKRGLTYSRSLPPKAG